MRVAFSSKALEALQEIGEEELINLVIWGEFIEILEDGMVLIL